MNWGGFNPQPLDNSNPVYMYIIYLHFWLKLQLGLHVMVCWLGLRIFCVQIWFYLRGFLSYTRG